MSNKVKRFTRKQLHREAVKGREEAKRAEKTARAEEKEREHSGRFYDRQLAGLGEGNGRGEGY